MADWRKTLNDLDPDEATVIVLMKIEEHLNNIWFSIKLWWALVFLAFAIVIAGLISTVA